MKGITNLEILDIEHGRWGNQLFRIAAMIGYAKKHNCDFYIPNTWQYAKYLKSSDNLYDFNNILFNIRHQHIQKGFHHEEIPSIDDGIIDIRGYFQSYKYFENATDEIINLFWSDDKFIDTIKSKYNIEPDTLCIHIRHGDPFDKLKHGNQANQELYHPTMTINYYNSAISKIIEMTHIRKVLIFTDHPETRISVENKIDTQGIDTEYIDYKDDFILDFYAQALCDHFIIPNSSFSWWSAFLSRNANKVICCPNKNEWFGPAYTNYIMDDLLPENWIQIKQ